MSERRCIVTGNVADPEELLRFARAPLDGQVIADLRLELPGRGVWIGNNRRLVSQAIKRNMFARGFREACKVPEGLDQRIEDRLDELALGYLSLAKKAGQAVHGFEKVETLISTGRLAVLIGACDGSADGRGKLKQRMRATGTEAPVIEFFSSGQLGLALGRTNVIHAAITSGGLARKFVIAANRAQKYRGSQDGAALEYEEKA
ncbi:MAG: RNA-binding protein [Rhizobiales bacterium]|nr:RNA-binding protein [Hyphomicrobiales bacterium]